MKCFVYFIVAVTDQPDNVTVCLGGTAVFTCVMDISNVTINKGDVKWWRIRTDQSSGILPLSESTARYKVTNTINNQRLNSTLIIANVISTLSGPYWPGRTENSHLCEMAFLSINGMKNLMCMYIMICIDIGITVRTYNEYF